MHSEACEACGEENFFSPATAPTRCRKCGREWKVGQATERSVIACPAPGCKVRLPQDDLSGQSAHMNSFHQDVIAARLESDGFWQDRAGNWVDGMSGD